MLDFLKRKGQNKSQDNTTESKGLLRRLYSGLTKTRESLKNSFSKLFQGKTHIDAETLEELEEILISADVGVSTSEMILNKLQEKLKKQNLSSPEEVVNALKEILIGILQPYEGLIERKDSNNPFVLLMVGVNGTGKTTTIGKLAKKFQQQGNTVMLAAGDTFRAAAIDQLKVWGERNQIPVIAQNPGSDSASVIFDALEAARSSQTDILIADTAGRLHTQSHLMDELKKVLRVIRKRIPEAPHEIMLVLDAGNGQNALTQAKIFHEALGLTGITLTKLDGTAKGGIIFNIAETLKLPIRYIGIGEGIEDLREFSAAQFVEALFSTEESET